MSSRAGRLAAAFALAHLSSSLAAQEAGDLSAGGSPPERIDLLAQTSEEIEGPAYEDCSAEQQAAEITGEIVICRRKSEDTAEMWDKEAWETRYAEKTKYKNDLAPVDVAGAGIFRGPATISGGCFIPPCPPPKALMIDIEALPEPPPGSDADRIARGLAPRGRDVAQPLPAGSLRESTLGLPPAPGFAEDDVSREGSAEPAVEP